MSFCAPPRAKSPLHQEVTFSYYTDLTIAKFHSPVSPDPLSARWLRSLGFLKSPPLNKILDPPMNTTYSKATDGGSNAGAGGGGGGHRPHPNCGYAPKFSRTLHTLWSILIIRKK